MVTKISEDRPRISEECKIHPNASDDFRRRPELFRRCLYRTNFALFRHFWNWWVDTLGCKLFSYYQIKSCLSVTCSPLCMTPPERHEKIFSATRGLQLLQRFFSHFVDFLKVLKSRSAFDLWARLVGKSTHFVECNINKNEKIGRSSLP